MWMDNILTSFDFWKKNHDVFVVCKVDYAVVTIFILFLNKQIDKLIRR